jgi:hypothetical protein
LPVPAYTTEGLVGSSATAPIESDGSESAIGRQVAPASPDRQTPLSFVEA